MILVSIVGCGSNSNDNLASGKISVVVSIPPQKFLVEEIGGEDVSVTTLVTPGQSCETFEPTPRQTADLINARLFFRTGEPFEIGLLNKISASFPNVAVVDLREGVLIQEHSHGGDHNHSISDPHIYLSPSLLKVQAQTATGCLIGLLPGKQKELTRNRDRFIARLDSLEREIKSLLSQFNGDTIVVGQPILGYFADDYGLVQLAVEKDGKEPGARELGELIDVALRLGVTTIFAQPQSSSKSADALAEAIGAKVLTLDPLREDVIHTLGEIAIAIRDELVARDSSFHREVRR
jgi:zinc transport system substrate-binding protein